MSLFKFLTKKSTLICLGILVALMFIVPVDVWAQDATGEQIVDQGLTGPFQRFLQRGSQLFAYTRNALFVVAAVAFLGYAWKAIQEGKIEWEKLFMLIVALVLLGVAGFIVAYMADPEGGNNIQQTYGGLQDTKGWE
ncbi:TrbC/VirB2 family protein [bacterium]|nr:TrbC/VirB2 family protein [bacterium]